MTYPVTVLNDKEIQIGEWLYTVKELKVTWKLIHKMGRVEVIIKVPKAIAADLNGLQARLQEKF